ncbi:MAG: ribonuclease III [Planctomycetota bacterium]|nr:ribonuclease III [Planctomycetota bacterium]
MNEMTPPDDTLSVDEKVELCQHIVKYQFQNRGTLLSALTHSSVATTRTESNERMEFLGDSILGMVVCERLFRSYPEYLEGELTKIKSVVVSRRVCAKISRQLGLDTCLIVGRGMLRTGMPRSLLSDVFEAIVAAIFLDGGYAAATNFVLEQMEPEIRLAADGHGGGNYKSLLQQLAQRDLKGTPVYRLVDESGPDHSKHFQIVAEISGRRYAPAWGRNKKEAEQRAAGNALCQLRGEEPPYTAM